MISPQESGAPVNHDKFCDGKYGLPCICHKLLAARREERARISAEQYPNR